MWMIVHEVIGVDLDAILILVFEQKVVIGLFCPIWLEEPVIVVALPGDMEEGVVVDDFVTGKVSHIFLLSKLLAK